MIWIFVIVAIISAADEDFDALNGTISLNGTDEYDDDGNFTFNDDPVQFYDLLPAQTNLSELIFKDYDNEVSSMPESFDLPDADKWPLALYVHQLKLLEVDEPNEQVSVVLEVLQLWPDARLLWEKEEHQNITALYVRLDKVWSPPFTVFSASEVVEHRDQNYRMVKINHTGILMAHIPMKVKVNCKLLMEDFPFDTQICEIRTGIPSLRSHLYEVLIDTSVDLKYFRLLGNSAWDIINITTGIELIKTQDSYYDDTKHGVVKVHLKRNPVYYLYMIVLPTFIINAISTAGVFLKNTDKIDRLTIGLTHIMTMTFILGIVADKLPKTEHIPLLGKYIIFSLATMISALVISTYLKKISLALVKYLKHHYSIFGQILRKLIGSPLRVTFIVLFQAANILASIYLLWRWIRFEREFGFKGECAIPKPTMEFTATKNITC